MRLYSIAVTLRRTFKVVPAADQRRKADDKGQNPDSDDE